MSLEDKVHNINTYFSVVGKSFAGSVASMVASPYSNKIFKRDRRYSYLETITDKSIYNFTTITIASSCLFDLKILGAVLASNAIAYGAKKYDTLKASEKGDDAQKSLNPKEKIKPRISLRNKVKGMKLNFKNRLHHLKTRVKLFAGTYAMMAGIAATHYMVAPKYEMNIGANYQQNVSIEECVLDQGKTKMRFSLLGETHIYNKTSSAFVKKYLEKTHPDVLLSEGVAQRENSLLDLIGYTQKIGSWASGYRSDGPINLFRDLEPEKKEPKKKIPQKLSLSIEQSQTLKLKVKPNKKPKIYALEDVDKKTGVREGVSKGELIFLGTVGAVGVVFAPQLYFAFIPPQYLGFNSPLLKLAQYLPKNGIIDGRNEKMAENAMEYMHNNPKDLSLIRVGKLHIDGMKKEFQKYGSLTCTSID